FRRTLLVSAVEPVTLEVEVPSAEVQILYSRDGQVSISGFAQSSADAKLDGDFFKAVLTIEQNGNQVRIRHVPHSAHPEGGINVSYRIDVPYRTQISSQVNHDSQRSRGSTGPVKAETSKGDVKASYISKGLQPQADQGN